MTYLRMESVFPVIKLEFTVQPKHFFATLDFYIAESLCYALWKISLPVHYIISKLQIRTTLLKLAKNKTNPNPNHIFILKVQFCL